jgi:hypothetical protein
MTKTKEEQAARVARVEKILRSYSADAMKSSGPRPEVDAYLKHCRDFVELLAAMETEVWGPPKK